MQIKQKNQVWSTKGIIPNRVHLPYVEDELKSGKMVFQDPESKPVKRKATDILRWISTTLPSGQILDVGSGPAHLTFWSVRTSQQFDIYSFDLSKTFLLQAKNRLLDAKFIQGDLLKGLPFKSGSFDGVIFSDILEHIPPDKALKAVNEANRVLRPGGWVFINIPNRITWTDENKKNSRHLWWATKQEIIDLLKSTGFNSKRISITTRGFPGSNLFHKIFNHDLYLPLYGKSIFIKASKDN